LQKQNIPLAMPSLKDELLKLANLLSIPQEEFADVCIHAWPAIMHKIEAAFFKKDHTNTSFTWSWQTLKEPHYAIQFLNGQAYQVLPQLVNASEKAWFAAYANKLWLFEGTIQAIELLIREHYPFEYYVVAKKYTWLLCENDHDILMGAGSVMAKMETLPHSSALVHLP
jgi:hypothetical protein